MQSDALVTFGVGLNSDEAKFERAIRLIVLVERKRSDLTSVQFRPVQLESAKLRQKALKWNIDHLDFTRDRIKICPVVDFSTTPACIGLQRPGIASAIRLHREPDPVVVSQIQLKGLGAN